MIADRPGQPIDYKLKSLLLRPNGLPKIRRKEGLKKRLFLLLPSLHREVLRRIRDYQLKHCTVEQEYGNKRRWSVSSLHTAAEFLTSSRLGPNKIEVAQLSQEHPSVLTPRESE